MNDSPTTGPLGEITLVESETFSVSGSSGQIRRGGEQGLYIRDTRVLDHLLLRIDGDEPVTLNGRALGPTSARFTAYWRATGDTAPDPRLFVDRRRVISASLWEEIHLLNFGLDPVRAVVELDAGSDFASIFDVKHGRFPEPLPVEAYDGGVRMRYLPLDQAAVLGCEPPADDVVGGVLRWVVDLAPRSDWTVQVRVGLAGLQPTVWPTRTWTTETDAQRASERPWSDLEISCSDIRVVSLVRQSVDDLASLLVADPVAPDDRFFAAGSPWYLTLFGRDSLWAAFMALPLDTAIAGQTLRTLARRQGTRHDPETEEAPGKILHEVRHGGLSERSDLPPLYYGSMDATPLFVTLLNEAWRWGLPTAEVADLLPAAERALQWLATDADPDGDGFLEYVRSTDRGLQNQGWKDSTDAIQFADGTLAGPPIALCEVQGYAYEAAIRGAELMEVFDRPGADKWRTWAADLRERFRSAFWIDQPGGGYPAMALDGAKRQVDGLGSNMGHLPATGLLDPDESARIAQWLSSAGMDSGWGLRTLTSDSPRYNPLSYHGGSVWPHDTAIAVHNLAVAGFCREASELLRGLVRAAPHFGYRLPELFAGEQHEDGGAPLPYPAACRPQAWAAGAALLMMRAAVGAHPHLPQGYLRIEPIWPFPFRALRLRGLRVAGQRLSLTIVRGRGVYVDEAPGDLELRIVGAPVLDRDPGPVGPLHD